MSFDRLRSKVNKYYKGGKILKADRGALILRMIASGNWDQTSAQSSIETFANYGLSDDQIEMEIFGDIGGSTSVASSINLRIDDERDDDGANFEGSDLDRAIAEGTRANELRRKGKMNAAKEKVKNFGSGLLDDLSDASVNMDSKAAKQMLKDGMEEGDILNFGKGMDIASKAANIADQALMGDKNFGAQSQAIDSTVHGVSGALMKSGNPYCVCAGTKVITKDGAIINIEDLKLDDGIIGWDGKNTVNQLIVWKPEPLLKDCVRISISSGISLECSIDHPILAVKPGRAPRIKIDDKYIRVKQWNFVDAGDLLIGDNIGLANNVDIWGNEEMWNPYLIGMLIGDGTYGKGSSVRLFTGDSDTWDYIERNELGKSLHVKEGKYSKEFREYRIINGCPHLRELGIFGQTKCNKRLPDNIHKYNKESICKLIAGLFDTDGTIRFDSKGNNHQIKFYQKNKKLIYQLYYQLVKLGIHGSISKNKAKEHIIKGRVVKSNECYVLTVKDRQSIINFYDNIKLNITYKQKALDDIYTSVLKVPNKDNRYLSGAKSVKIINIEHIGKQLTYNLQANEDHTYLANCIITHNCMIAGAALEGANFLTKAGGQTVQGFDVDIDSSGYGNMGHMASSSSRDFGAMIGLGGLNRGRMQAKLARRNLLARMALEAADVAATLKFEQEARMDSIQNTLINNQQALNGGIQLGSLGA